MVYGTSGTGECFYAGCTQQQCQIHDSLFENNYCHDTCSGPGGAYNGGSYGSGFQIKLGSYRNILRKNVCFNTNSPCILLYGDTNLGVNIAEGNVIINTVSDSGIQVAAGAIFRNNIVIGSYRSGITVTNNPNDLMSGQGNRNLLIEHNTFVNNGKYGIEFQSTPTTTTVLNNAALGNTNGDFSSQDQTGVTWHNNAYNTGSLPSGVQSGGAFLVGSTTTQLVSPSTFNVYPTSTSKLLKAGAQSLLPYDFNYFARNCTPTGFFYCCNFSFINQHPLFFSSRSLRIHLF